MNGVFRLGLHSKGTSEQKLEEERGYARLSYGNCTLARENSQCTNPGAEACLVHLRDSKEPRVAGVEWAQGNVAKGEFWQGMAESGGGVKGGAKVDNQNFADH